MNDPRHNYNIVVSIDEDIYDYLISHLSPEGGSIIDMAGNNGKSYNLSALSINFLSYPYTGTATISGIKKKRNSISVAKNHEDIYKRLESFNTQ